MITVYGIKNCDSVKKTLQWLSEHDVRFKFHDLRKDGLERQMLDRWVASLGWETLINRRGLTWRRLPKSTQNGLTEAKATQLMLDTPTLIKRPVIESPNGLQVGYKPDDFEHLIG